MSKHGGSYVTSRADVNLLSDRRHRGSRDYFWLPSPCSDVSRLPLCFTSSRRPSGRCRLYDNFSARSSWNIRRLCTHTWHY